MATSDLPFELEPVPSGGTRLRAAATIGVFDGVHRGHQDLFTRVQQAAGSSGAASLVLTFDPYPIEVFAPSVLRHRIASRPVSARFIRSAGMEHVWFLPFSREMAGWEPDRFLDHLLSALDLTSLWVGPDFRFGRNRTGDFSFLEREGQARGFAVHRIEPRLEEGRQISSTWIRELLRDGKVREASGLLGHPFELEGPVVHGQGLGAKELVPTANLELGADQLLPRRGIYAGWAVDPSGRWTERPLPAVASVGVRPTLGPEGEDWVEVHILDWEKEIYGERLAFSFTDWIRPEENFASLDALREAIGRDLVRARELLLADNGTSALHPDR